MEDFKVSKIKKIVAYLLTLAMLISVFNFSSFASKADETVDENTLITSEVSSDEIDETSENTTGEITEEPENIPEYLSETSTEDVTEDLIEDETTETTEDVTEEVLDNTEEVTEITTEEEVTEDESPYLYLKMSEGGSIRFNNATYSVDDDILYKDLVEYARPNNLGYFKIDEDLTSVSVIALAELNGTISDFKVSSYDGSNFTLLYQGNSGIDCQMKKTINISDDTYLDIVFIEGDNVCINDDNMLNGATTEYFRAIPSMIGRSFISNYPTNSAGSGDPQPNVSNGTTTSGTFSVISPTYNTSTTVTFTVQLHGGLLDGLTLHTTCSAHGANNIFRGCAVDGDSYTATATVSGGTTTWIINTGNESYPCVWLPSENRYGHGFQTSRGIYSYGTVSIQAYVSLCKSAAGANSNAYKPSTEGITYDLVDGSSSHNKFVKFTLGEDGYPASISAYTTRIYADADSYIDYVGTIEIDGVLYAHFSLTNYNWYSGIFLFTETATNDNYELERDSNGNPVYHSFESIANGESVIVGVSDNDFPDVGAVQVIKVDESGDFVSGAGYTLYKNGEPCADASGNSTKTTSSSGLITFYGLSNGSYMIKETSVPASNYYNIDTKEYNFTINTNNSIKGFSYVYDNNYYYNSSTSSSEHSVIENGWGTGKYAYFSHYYSYGCNEGRRGNSTFNQSSYVNNYADVKSYCADSSKIRGYDYVKAAKHYQNNGASENRKTLTDAEYRALANKSINGNSTGLVIIKSLDTSNAYVYVKKKTSSSCTELVADNTNYSLAGAKFKIYKNAACTEQVTTNAYDFITDSSGNTTAINVSQYMTANSMTLYIKETEASKGYNINTTPQRVVVTRGTNTASNPATVTIEEVPQDDPAVIVLTKRDSENNEPIEGAIYEVRYYAQENLINNNVSETYFKRHWFLKTDSNGYAGLASSYLTTFEDYSSDNLYYNESGRPTLPLGYITIQEVQAPEEYIIDTQKRMYKVTNHILRTVDTNAAVEPTVTEQPKKQAFQLIKLAEDGTNDLKPMANAGFMACKVSDLSVDAEGNYIFDKTKAVDLALDGSKEMFTDDDGYALSAELRYGTYIVRETTTPTGYLPVADFTVTVTEDSRTPQRIVYKTDKQKKYYLRITKIDKMTNNPIFDNSATYKIWSYADNDYVSFRTYTGSRFENISEFKTAEDGILITPGTLVYGDYRIDEIKTPDYYNNDSPDGIDFTIDDYTIYVTYEEAGDTAVGLVDIVFKDTSYLGQIKINKSAEVREFDDEKHEYAVIDTIPLKDIEFGIYAAEDIISQDGHNVVLYSKGDLIETIVTDEDGYAESTPLLPLGKYVVVEENTPEDYIKAEDIDVIISSQGELKELDYNMEKIKVDIHEYDVLNKTKIPTISTFASDGATNSHVGTVGEEVTINDVCKMTGLIPGRKYAVDGYQMVVETKLPFLDDGKPVTSYCEFVATDEEMEITMPYTLDSSQLEGKTLNTYENLYEMGGDDTDENNKKKVAEHHVLEDENQNIHYPDIKTSVKDNITGTHIGTVSRNVTITDSCECTNLVIGKKYKIYGKQMVVETNKPLLVNGKEVTSEKSFVATEKNMTIDLSYTFDSSALAGKVINTFEWLYTDDINVNSHTDLTDEEQNLEFKEIQVKLIKKDKFEDTKTLPGVTFVLFKKSDSIIKNTDDELIEFSEQLPDDDKKYAEEYKINADDLFIGKYVTDENGEINVDNLTLGDYYFVETETLYRYLLNNFPQEFTIEDYSEDTIVVLTVLNDGRIGTLSIHGRTTPNYNGRLVRTGDNHKPIEAMAVMLVSALMCITMLVVRRRIKNRR